MPTGYTQKLMEEGQSFPEFAMTCARAFGALVMMRDDSLDAPIPKAFKPSDYSVKQLSLAKKKLSKLKGMTDAQKLYFGSQAKRAELKRLRKLVAEQEEQNKRLDQTVVNVAAWKPPTGEHKGLKEFMLEQINVSKNDVDYYYEAIVKAEKKSPEDFYREAVDSAVHMVTYFRDDQKKEIKRAKNRTKWVQKLRKSLNL